MTVNESYEQAFSEMKEKLNKKKSLRDKKTNSLITENGEYRGICASLAECGMAYAKSAFSGDKSILTDIQKKMEKLSKRKTEILAENGIEDIKYDCPLCEDTGYVGGKICKCIEEAAKKLYVSSLSQKIPLKSNTFENFDLSFYTEPDAKKRMTSILNLAESFARNFSGDTHESLLFIGNPGLGKTHLTLSIVGEVIKKGYFVIYGSAYNLFAQMETEHFEKHINESFENAVNCDLLCIDDLGSEFVSPYIQTLVYNIVNTRLLAGKPTIISTNLSIKEIEVRYTERVSSRLLSYTPKMFLGTDIRQQKIVRERNTRA